MAWYVVNSSMKSAIGKRAFGDFCSKDVRDDCDCYTCDPEGRDKEVARRKLLSEEE